MGELQRNRILSSLSLLTTLIAFYFIYNSDRYMTQLEWVLYIIFISPFALFCILQFFRIGNIIKKISLILLCIIAIIVILFSFTTLDQSDYLTFLIIFFLGAMPFTFSLLYLIKEKSIFLTLILAYTLLINILIITDEAIKII